MPKANSLPIIGYWNPNAEIERRVRTQEAWQWTGFLCITIVLVMLANLQLAPGWLTSALPLFAVASVRFKGGFLNRALKMTAKKIGPCYRVGLHLYRENGLKEPIQGLMQFEGRYLHFSGKDCEFVFDAGRIRNQQHMVESIPFSYRIREIEVDGNPLYLDIQIIEAYGIELAKGELVSFDDLVREASLSPSDPDKQEILPPISPRPSPNFADPSYMVGVWFGLALLCAIVSAWVWLGGHSPMPFLSGPFGVLVFVMLGALTARQRKRFIASQQELAYADH